MTNKTEFAPYDVVELIENTEGYPSGTRGTIVLTDLDKPHIHYVEIADAQGRTLEILPCDTSDIRLVSAHRSSENAGGAPS